MPLDPQMKVLLEAINAAPAPDPDSLSPAEMRAMFDSMPIAPGPVEEVVRVEERAVPGAAGSIPVRIYTPEGEGALPVLVFFHGGGFVIGSLDTHDATCRSLANAAGCIVVSVAYRLAPEAPYPAAPEDCYAATVWVAATARELGADPSRIAVGGDSAGGNLAAVVALMARDRSGPRLVHQLLVYPVTDHRFDTASYRDNAEGYMLSRAMMKWFWRHYLEKPSDGEQAYASPLRCEGLADLPPATVITAEFDPLRDEGEAYARRLQEAGVPVEQHRYDGVIHGFFSMASVLDRARDALAHAAGNLRTAFAA